MKRYVSMAEIADQLGRSRQTIATWNRRRKMPTPAGRTRGGPFWDPETIRPWMEWWQQAQVTHPARYIRLLATNLGYATERDFWDRVRLDRGWWVVPAADGSYRIAWNRTGFFERREGSEDVPPMPDMQDDVFPPKQDAGLLRANLQENSGKPVREGPREETEV